MKTVIEMAREAGATFDHMTWVERDLAPVFERFAALVREDERERNGRGDYMEGLEEGYAAGQRDEREKQQETERGDAIPQDSDGCPTEKAVLQRFWRNQQIPDEHYPEWYKTIETAVLAEREACAKVCEETGETWKSAAAGQCAAAIRARGEK